MQSRPYSTNCNSHEYSTNAGSLTEELLHHSPKKPYTWLPESCINQIVGSSGEAKILQAVLSNLLNGFRLERSPVTLPDSIGVLYDREIERIKSTGFSAPAANLPPYDPLRL